ncbi:MAG: hypothetical protein BRD50_06305 [Bacteroidetes bacterium SW_11_45_7]|nr:MAG: hypothetical protein BRD50_06305 [Bacteroidetes bacterium SW_11_45_7]
MGPKLKNSASVNRQSFDFEGINTASHTDGYHNQMDISSKLWQQVSTKSELDEHQEQTINR